MYAAATVQGVALVTFPAASTIFTSPSYYGLSSTAYGAMFLPQAVTAIGGSLLGARLTRSWGIKRVFHGGSDRQSQFDAPAAAQPGSDGQSTVGVCRSFLVATTCLGVGFGLTVPSLNTFVAAFFPDRGRARRVDPECASRLGTVLAPVFVAIFVGLGALVRCCRCWSLPCSVDCCCTPCVCRLQSRNRRGASRAEARPTSGRFWVFAAFAALYGIVETMNGNWATLYMANDLGATTTLASLALTAFWGMVTVGRVLFAAIERAFPEQRTYHVLPFVAAIALGIIALLPPCRAAWSRHPGVRAGWAGLLGAAAADHRLRPGGVGDDGRLGGGAPDRVLSDGLWHRRLRRRAAGTDRPGWTCARSTCSSRSSRWPWPRCHSWSLRADPGAKPANRRGSPPCSTTPGVNHRVTPERASLVLLALILVAAVANLNPRVANVALPSIGLAFNASQTSLNLIAVGYSLGLAGSVLYFGALGDRYGRKMMLILGMALAIPFSVLAAFAPNENVLFIARVGGGLSAGWRTPPRSR